MFWLLLGFALIALIDLAPLIRRRKGRAVAAFLVAFAAGLTLSVLQVKNVEVPSVMLLWQDLFRALGWAYMP